MSGIHRCVCRFGGMKVTTVALLCAAIGGASANDGGIAMGGSPQLLSSHPSVSMTSEVIKMTVGEKDVFVDCSFVFTNSGKACTVRMGFPDVGIGANDPDEETEQSALAKTPPHTTFQSFASYVNGSPVKTKLIRADEEGHYWHTKTVRFPAHSVVRVRDVYRQLTGGGIVNIGKQGGNASEVAYILHTGSSWHGPIGRSEVDVTFKTPVVSQPQPVSQKEASGGRAGHSIKKALPPDSVVWKGPCAPTVSGKTLRFVRTNWRPKPSDDIELTYGYKTFNSE
jgi:hypothetical protein